eukprot:TRINITY_DN2983_c0_g1_i1.p1 TRINITY_DN2983_c0_g1~~TRINITY_DN2983_c0_g1_i1.p1  ORF type:complete len:480 (-),score=136.60 TRINITY_DN2983_c0_g1_i1:219-1658(-)
MTDGWIQYARKYVDKREATEPNRLPILVKRRQKHGEALAVQDYVQGLVDNEAAIRDRALDALPDFLSGFADDSEGQAAAAAAAAETEQPKTTAAAAAAGGKKKEPEDPFAKLWHGLIMCYWHTDRPLTQLDVANRIAAMVHRIPSPNARVRWIGHFFAAIVDAWSKIDTHRIDKYLSLIRRVLCDAFRVLKGLPADANAEDLVPHLGKADGKGKGNKKGSAVKSMDEDEEDDEEVKPEDLDAAPIGKKRRKLLRKLQQEEKRKEKEHKERERERLKGPQARFWEVLRKVINTELVSIPMHLADIWLDEGIEAGLPAELYTRSLQLWLDILSQPSPLATHVLLRVFSLRNLSLPTAPIDKEDLLRRVRQYVDPEIKSKQQLAFLQILHNLNELDEAGQKAIMKWHPEQLKQERLSRHEKAKRIRKATLKPRKSQEEREELALQEKKRGNRRGHRTKGVGPSRVKRTPGSTVMRNTVVNLF